MKKIIPEKLKKGDEIRVISPSRSMHILGDVTVDLATKKLEEMGFKVTYGKSSYNYENESYGCASIDERVEDLHEAFKDKNVKAILTSIGGFNVNQILDYIDYDLIRENPKVFCGFSDITALSDAIYSKTGLVTYYGPHFSSFAMQKGFDYTEKYFKQMLMEDDKVNITSSDEWSNDLWFIDQDNRTFIKNEGMKIINEGTTSGKIVGGNLCTLNLLQGTEFMPELDGAILFIEDDGGAGSTFNLEFDRNLQSLLHLAKNNNIKGIVVGRAEKNSEMTFDKWKYIFETKKELNNIPIVVDADFGHTTPIFTFPIGGKVTLKVENNKIELEISD